jgi:hypothetical protein
MNFGEIMGGFPPVLLVKMAFSVCLYGLRVLVPASFWLLLRLADSCKLVLFCPCPLRQRF